MKFLSAFILTMLLSFAAGLFFPWWIIAVTAFIVALLVPLRPWLAFITGFMSLFLVWGLQALYIDMRNQHVLATRITGVLKLGSSYYTLIVVTAIVGALVGGMAALTGSYLRRILFHQSRIEQEKVQLHDGYHS